MRVLSEAQHRAIVAAIAAGDGDAAAAAMREHLDALRAALVRAVGEAGQRPAETRAGPPDRVRRA
jgi:DNA-binding GntR family transcriptional regulator